jgi:phage-related protein
MKTNKMQFRKVPALSVLTTFLWFGFATLACAQSTPAPAQNPVQDNDNKRPSQNRDNSLQRPEVARFNEFLDSHQEIAEQLRKNPSLANNQEFLQSHPALRTYLQDHPEISQQLKENPDAFMREEGRFGRDADRADRNDRDTNRRELANFNQFLDSHRETAERLRKDPSLVNNQQFLKDHTALQSYLQDHPAVRQEIKENPDAFMREEDRFGRDTDRADRNDRDTSRRELANFSQFLDSHRETAERLRRDPSLVDNQQFLKDHTALQSYLQDHPAVRQEIKESPDAFMQQEARYEHHDRDEDMNRDWRGGRDTSNGHFASFGEFLGAHSNIAEQISKDPSLVKNQEYLQNHPELQAYLNSHPAVRHDLMADPQGFVKSAQQFNANSQAIKTPMTPSETKPIKQ